MLWHARSAVCFRALRFRVVATDVDPALLEWAPADCYRASSPRELPTVLRVAAVEHRGELFRVRKSLRQDIESLRQDIHASAPDR